MPTDEHTLTIPATDGRTIEELKADDSYEALTVHEISNGGMVSTEEGTGFGIPKEKLDEWRERTGKEPKAGMAIRLYPGGLGSRIHGVDLDGDEVYWETPAERVADRAEWLADYDRRQREEFAEEKEQLDRDYESLPDPLKKRIDRYRAEDEGFRITSEGYELFACVEAAKFAARAREAVADHRHDDRVDEFWSRTDRGEDKVWSGDRPEEPEVAWLIWAWALNSELFDYDYEEERRVLDHSPEHSGNTFGGAMMLAIGLIQGKEL